MKKTTEGDRIKEAEMADVVERILKRQPNKSAQFSELFEIVPKHLKMSKADLAESESRPGEQLWQQIVRNLKVHEHEGFEGVAGGICLEGYAAAATKAAVKAKAEARAEAKAKVKAAKAKAKAKFKKGKARKSPRKSARKSGGSQEGQRANA